MQTRKITKPGGGPRSSGCHSLPGGPMLAAQGATLLSDSTTSLFIFSIRCYQRIAPRDFIPLLLNNLKYCFCLMSYMFRIYTLITKKLVDNLHIMFVLGHTLQCSGFNNKGPKQPCVVWGMDPRSASVLSLQLLKLHIIKKTRKLCFKSSLNIDDRFSKP